MNKNFVRDFLNNSHSTMNLRNRRIYNHTTTSTSNFTNTSHTYVSVINTNNTEPNASHSIENSVQLDTLIFRGCEILRRGTYALCQVHLSVLLQDSIKCEDQNHLNCRKLRIGYLWTCFDELNQIGINKET